MLFGNGLSLSPDDRDMVGNKFQSLIYDDLFLTLNHESLTVRILGHPPRNNNVYQKGII